MLRKNVIVANQHYPVVKIVVILQHVPLVKMDFITIPMERHVDLAVKPLLTAQNALTKILVTLALPDSLLMVQLKNAMLVVRIV